MEAVYIVLGLIALIAISAINPSTMYTASIWTLPTRNQTPD